jgi:hypothetical protein
MQQYRNQARKKKKLKEPTVPFCVYLYAVQEAYQIKSSSRWVG